MEHSEGLGTARTGARASFVDWLEPLDDRDRSFTPSEVAQWLRTLPSSKVGQDTKRVVARRVLERKITGHQFEEIVGGCQWTELAVGDERERVALARLFRQFRREAALAEAARRTALCNASAPPMKGQMLIA